MNGWERAWVAVILFSGSYSNIFLIRSQSGSYRMILYRIVTIEKYNKKYNNKNNKKDDQ